MSDTARNLFIGLDVPADVCNDIRDCAESMADAANRTQLPLSWVRPAGYHIPLYFLGWTHEASIPSIVAAIEKCSLSGGTSIGLKGIDCFPSLEEASAVYAKVDKGSKELSELVETLDGPLTHLGLPRRSTAFTPHLVLGRCAGPTNLKSIALPWSEQSFKSWKMRELILFESTTDKSGAYQQLHHFTF